MGFLMHPLGLGHSLKAGNDEELPIAQAPSRSSESKAVQITLQLGKKNLCFLSVQEGNFTC